MTLKEILDMCDDSVVYIALIIFLSLVEVSKIPVNPWSFIWKIISRILKSIGKAMNEDIYKELMDIKESQKEMQKQINSVSDKADENAMKDKRSRILNFYNECFRGVQHSREEYDNIIETYVDYNTIIKEKNFVNGKIDNAYAYIMETYHECEKNHTFIV